MSDLLLRPLAEGEAAAALDVHLSARLAAAESGTMPPLAHPLSDAPRWFGEVIGTREVWVAERSGRLVGLLVLDTAFVDQLYVRPGCQRRGIGSALLDLAKALRPGGFDLWVFEVNAPAIALYERAGMTVAEQTRGAGNDERAPDRRYRWAGARRAAPTSVGPGAQTGLA
ncbi:MAG: family N-acetyltransferase [Nocardioidaceae bacterium]|nr:family N-acetyltransferase [Nocardioidaceae bacterium]